MCSRSKNWMAGGAPAETGGGAENRGRDRVGDVDLLGTQPQRSGARDLDTIGEQHPFQPLHLPARANRARDRLQRGDRDRSQQLDREPRDERRGSGVVARRARARAACWRATVQCVRRPGPASEWCRHEPFTVANEQRAVLGDRVGGHAAS